MPWRNKKLEIEDVDYETVYNNNIQVITTNRNMFSIITDEVIDEVLDEVNKDNLEKERGNDSMGDFDKSSKDQRIDIFDQAVIQK